MTIALLATAALVVIYVSSTAALMRVLPEYSRIVKAGLQDWDSFIRAACAVLIGPGLVAEAVFWDARRWVRRSLGRCEDCGRPRSEGTH
ncbi:hypothetical protein [Nocardia wallacei]|uniref:hypothetical protein n=1 Tax=Nocardia wallacei TaxID=480035 RepID=UPI002453B8A4|nr:hypothetical protein [Nocardia wallacei]